MRFHFWHTAFSLFFVVLVLVAVSWLGAADKLSPFVPLADFVLMALAVFRLVHLFVYDSITAFIRDWFAGEEPRSFLGTMGHLVNCPWCMGLWFSLLVVFFYFATPLAWYVILILALAAVGSFLQILTNLIGWHAEAKKREVKGIPLPR